MPTFESQPPVQLTGFFWIVEDLETGERFGATNQEEMARKMAVQVSTTGFGGKVCSVALKRVPVSVDQRFIYAESREDALAAVGGEIAEEELVEEFLAAPAA